MHQKIRAKDPKSLRKYLWLSLVLVTLVIGNMAAGKVSDRSMEVYARKQGQIPEEWNVVWNDGKYLSAYLFSSVNMEDYMLCVFEKDKYGEYTLPLTHGFSNYDSGVYVYPVPLSKNEWIVFALGDCNVGVIEIGYADTGVQSYKVDSSSFVLVVSSGYSDIAAMAKDGTQIPINIFP